MKLSAKCCPFRLGLSVLTIAFLCWGSNIMGELDQYPMTKMFHFIPQKNLHYLHCLFQKWLEMTIFCYFFLKTMQCLFSDCWFNQESKVIMTSLQFFILQHKISSTELSAAIPKNQNTIQIAKFMGPNGAHLGLTGPRWAPWGPHEPCYQGTCTIYIHCNYIEQYCINILFSSLIS